MSNFITFTKSTPKRTPNSTLLTQKKYSEPRIYTGGLTSLYGISSQTRTVYSAKDWYVYYKFIDDSTGKLKRMPNKSWKK
jgi:hypothetical protein